MSDAPASPSEGFRVTGRFVLICLLGFFALVAAVNGTMLRAAFKTFPGVDAENAYKAGLAFNSEIAAAEQQARRNWHVDVGVVPDSSGIRLDIKVQSNERQLPGQLAFKGKLAHPMVRSRDIALEATQPSPGRFIVDVEAEPGQWQLDFTISDRDAVMFRSSNRLFIP